MSCVLNSYLLTYLHTQRVNDGLYHASMTSCGSKQEINCCQGTTQHSVSWNLVTLCTSVEKVAF